MCPDTAWVWVGLAVYDTLLAVVFTCNTVEDVDRVLGSRSVKKRPKHLGRSGVRGGRNVLLCLLYSETHDHYKLQNDTGLLKLKHIEKHPLCLV